MMKLSLMSLMFLLSITNLSASDKCTPKRTITAKVKFMYCENINNSSSLPQIRSYFQQGAGLVSEQTLFAKGHIIAPNGNSIYLDDLTKIPSSSLRLNIFNQNGSEVVNLYKNYRANIKEVHTLKKYGLNIEVNKYILKTAQVKTFTLPTYTLVAPNVFNQYVIPEARISYFIAEPQTCTSIQGTVDAIERCYEEVDEGEIDCRCSIEKVLQ